jgi:hypothetical protein
MYRAALAGAAADLLSTAKVAFVDAFHVGAIISASVVIVTAVLVAILLRDVRPNSA